jgi:hypothetical protein
MTPGRMPYDSCPGMVEAWIIGKILENVVSCETDVLKRSGPAAARVSDPAVLYVARDYSLGSEGGAEMFNVRQVIKGLPETTMDNKEHREWSLTVGKPKLSKLIGIIAIAGPHVERK